MRMKKNTEYIVDDNGITIEVDYSYEKSPRQIEECHGYHDVGNLVYTEINHVYLCIDGRDIDILPLLHENEKEAIISKLTY
jgi:hypothetical protein